MSDEFNSDDEFSDGEGADEVMEEGLGITQQDLNDLNEDQFRSIINRMHNIDQRNQQAPLHQSPPQRSEQEVLRTESPTRSPGLGDGNVLNSRRLNEAYDNLDSPDQVDDNSSVSSQI